MSFLEDLHWHIQRVFQEHPHRFFTEHDIHSALHPIATQLLNNTIGAHTSDAHLVNRIHHEYPPPFQMLYEGHSIPEDY